MPNLTKTIIVPPKDPIAVLDLPIIKMIVLGNRPAMAQLADDLAQAPPIVDRQVIWFTEGLPANYQKQFNIADSMNVQAFSLTVKNKVADVIKTSEDDVDEVRMDQAYTNAGE